MPGNLDLSETVPSFKACDQVQLSANDYSRFAPKSDKIAHALIFSEQKHKYCQQFATPLTAAPDGTAWRPLMNVREENSHGGTIVRANTPNGTEMESRRPLEVSVTGRHKHTREHKLWLLTPRKSATTREQSIFKSSEMRRQARAEEAAKSRNIKSATWQVKSKDVLQRSNKTRSPDQNTVMGYSAWEAGVSFYSDQSGDLHADKIAVCLQNINARDQIYGGSEQAQWRWEWLHGQAWGLTELNYNPQISGNLAAAPKWVNNLMMIVERTAKWHALNYPNAEITGKFAFTMIPNTEIMEHGSVEFTIKINDRTVHLKQDLNPWLTKPDFPRATDIMQTTLVTNGLLLKSPSLVNRCI